jgi:hypothetical protein
MVFNVLKNYGVETNKYWRGWGLWKRSARNNCQIYAKMLRFSTTAK